MRSQNSIVLDDWEEFTLLILMTQITKELFQKTMSKFEIPMAAILPCKREAQTSTTKVVAMQDIASQKIPKKMYVCIMESQESTRQRVESSPLAKHKDHSAGNGFTSMTHYYLVHKFIPMPQAMRIPDAKAAVDKEWQNLETIPAWKLEKVKSKKEVLLEAQRDKKRGVRTKIAKIQRQSRAPWWHCKRRLWSLRSLHWTGLVCVSNDSSESNGCHCETAHAVSAFSQVKLEIAQNSWVRMSRRMDTSYTTQIAEILGKHWRSCGTVRTKFIWTPSGSIVMGKTMRGSSIGTWMGKRTYLGMFVCSSKTMIIFISTRGWHQNGCKEAECGSHVEEIDGKRWSWRTSFISWPCLLRMHSTGMQTKRENYWTVQQDVWVTYFCWSNRKLRVWQKPHAQTVAWSYDMDGHARKCAERYSELANKKVKQLCKVSSPCLDDYQFKQEELESVGDLSQVCSQIVLKCLYLARIGRPDILWSGNKLARSFTKWAKACDKRLSRLISSVHHTCEYKQYCHVGNTAKQCRLGLFQDSDFAGDLEDSKSTSGGTLCVFGSHTFVPISWMC